ncbi:hypothetical protein SK128_004022 [Halocaridina rubra]|uniref:RING-type domain-containing protein n=1 Tax=Halocaridina rubra TaxID=373956 RepID=A0AAN9A1L5_HALRR
MLGKNKGCGGPVSWWCSEVWRCSPRVSPDIPTASAKTSEMADCDQCSAKFTLLKRKRICGDCGLPFCGSCIQRGIAGTRRCKKCLVLSQWPLDRSQVAALRVRDLRHFLNAKRINIVACTEKRDLIDLVTRHICSQHGGSDRMAWQNAGSSNANSYSTPEHSRVKSPVSPVTRDDGIRVRPSSIISDKDYSNMGSIRVRPMDDVREGAGSQPTSPDLSDYDPETDLGIRVFASGCSPNQEPRASSVSPISLEGCSESPEEECSRCPSDDCAASYCSLDSCHLGASSQPSCPHKTETSSHCSSEDVSVSSEGMPHASTVLTNRCPTPVAQDDLQSIHNERPEEIFPSSSSQHLNRRVESSEVLVDTAVSREVDSSVPPLEEGSQPSSATSPSSVSPTTLPTDASSPEPSKQFGRMIVALEELKCEEDIHGLSIRQCKEILALHRVNLSGVREKSELINKVIILWKDYKNSQQDVEGLPEELVCKICMDSVIDCVFLECGHMVACTQCGKQMSECPVCRQYVIRIVRTFRA